MKNIRPSKFFREAVNKIYKPIRESHLATKMIRKFRYQIGRAENHTQTNLDTIEVINHQLQKNGGRILIVFPVIPWFYRWQRPQHILSMFAQDGYIVLHLPVDLRYTNFFVKDNHEAFRYVKMTELSDNILEVGIFSKGLIDIYLDPMAHGQITQFFCALDSVLSQLAYQQITFLTHFPGWSPLMFRLQQHYEGKIIFDCMDDHSGFKNSSHHVLSAEDELVKKADLVVVSSTLLKEKADKQNSNTLLIRNATEFDHFNALSPSGELKYLADKPIIGYYGAIAEWFDFDMLLFCAKEKPEWNFVLIGSTFSMDISMLSNLPNVFFLGEKSYQELPGYVYFFDVCLIPFKIIPLTLATSGGINDTNT